MKAKSLSNNTLDDYILLDRYNKNESEYYIFLLEGKPERDKDLESIRDQIDRAGYRSYFITSATNGVYIDANVKSKTEYMESNKSSWTRLINYDGKHVSAIMAFGSSLYQINKGTDLMVDEFYDTQMMKPYYYIGHGFIGNYDTFIFPVDGHEKLYPVEYKKGHKFTPNQSNINWKTRFFYEQIKNMLGEKDLPKDMRDYNIHVCNTSDEIELAICKLMNSEVLAYDTETNSLKWYKETSHIHCLQFCNDGVNGYYFPANLVYKSEKLKDMLIDMFYSANTVVGANIKFDLHYLQHDIPEFDFLKLKHIDDTGQLIHAISSELGKGLKPAAFRWTPFGGYDDELDKFKRQTKVSDYSKIPINILSKYATLDAIVTYRIFFAMTEHISWVDKAFPNEKNKYLPADDQWTMKRWYDEVMQEAYPYFVAMEHFGLQIDREYMLEARRRLQARIPVVQKKLAETWGVPIDFKFGSTMELGKQIEKMGWPCVVRNEAGNYATSDECIQEWKRQNQPGIKDLIQLRLLNSILGTFIGIPSEDGIQDNAKGWEQFITYHPEDKSWRVHHSYQIMGTSTYRCIGNDPNLQNIPQHADIASEVKRCITVPTDIHYTLDFGNGVIIEGGDLDTIEVIRNGKQLLVHLNEVTEVDDYVPGSFKTFTYEHQECFDDLEDIDFLKELIDEYGGDIDQETKIKLSNQTNELWSESKEETPKVERKILRRVILK